ncbi:hypothetical protein tb265_23560 [Gemmatimonadetes bacterium T265]|nr:hypothetical protein tb265_23560 [Gemmatimonadetes bacterium T265]
MRVVALAAAALAAASLPAALGAQAAERYTLRGDDVAVYDPAGRVQLVAGSGGDVVVEVTRRGRDAGRLRVLTGEVRGHDALRVVAPAGDLVYPDLGRGSNVTFRVRSDGTFGGNDGGFFASLRSDRLTIRGDGGGVEAWAEVTVYVPTGRRVAVHVGAGAAEARNVDGDLTLDVHAAQVSTEGTRGRLVVDAGSGQVRVRDAQGREVNLDTGSGGVEARGIRADRLRVDAGSGSVQGGDVEASDVNLDTGSGGMRLDKVRARTIKLDAGSGSVDLELVGDVERANIDTGSGGITLRLPPTLGATLDIDAGSGGIHTDVPVQVTRSESGHLTGRVGDGRGRIVIDAGSGGVRIVPAR